ncbi:hypothetical protein DH2020_023999 [Rehmannia glutinosa]|uniref:PB1 domain-containing protein n=1 Tax=Rehmannia glutinosa TaxID=99300 RepID=A0ABR0WA44_REHGL
MENYSYNSSSYPESGHSSPRSREIEFENPPPWEDPQSNQPPPNYKVKFMCSYGGKIHPRPHDNQLSYIGGETKILSVDWNIKFGSLLSKLAALCDADDGISFKYQLPGEDLDALISVTNDDDLEHMMHEYDRLCRAYTKPARLRIFVFQSQNPSLNSVRSFGSDEVKTEKERFVEALNSAPQHSPAPQLQPPASDVDFLFGLEKAKAMAVSPHARQPPVGRVQELEDPVVLPGLDERLIGSDPIQKHIHDLQRLRIEEQQGVYRRKSEDNISGGFTGGEYYKPPEKISQVAVAGGVPYWTEKQFHVGAFSGTSVNNEQPVYMISAPSNAYHATMVRAPTQGYYAVQRIPSEVYRDQQQIYNMVPQGAAAVGPPTLPPQKVTGYSEGFGMVRPTTTGGVGMVTEGGYAQVAYDSGAGRQVVYSAPGGVMGAPASVQAAQYHAMAAAVSADMRTAGALNVDAAGKAIAKATQGSM